MENATIAMKFVGEAHERRNFQMQQKREPNTHERICSNFRWQERQTQINSFPLREVSRGGKAIFLRQIK
jgi:hypothetical protein